MFVAHILFYKQVIVPSLRRLIATCDVASIAPLPAAGCCPQRCTLSASASWITNSTPECAAYVQTRAFAYVRRDANDREAKSGRRWCHPRPESIARVRWSRTTTRRRLFVLRAPPRLSFYPRSWSKSAVQRAAGTDQVYDGILLPTDGRETAEPVTPCRPCVLVLVNDRCGRR